MKTILIATDFSGAGRSAVLYGIELARAFNAKALLFSAYQPVPLPVSEVPVIVNSDEVRAATVQQLDSENRIINRSGSIDVEMVCEEGPAAQVILQTAREKQADVIVVGMKSDHKGLRKMFGSVVSTLVRRAPIPLVVVPEKSRYERPGIIALASASDLAADADSHVLDTLKEFATNFNSKVYITQVNASEFQDAYASLHPPLGMLDKLKAVAPIYATIENEEVTEGLNEFINRYQVNMLALLPHKRSGLDRLFYRSVTREMVFEAEVPLLILPERPTNR
jgi:nucleotide-binding universal stress UspA family protein